MSSVRAVTLLFVLLWGTTKGQNVQVSCVFMDSCVLPCSFQSGPEPVIHWLKTPGDVSVHSYFYAQDQLSHQHQDFKERTSLSEDQISRGNASLLLREVKVQDEGTYRCYTSTANGVNKDSFIDLRVRGSVSFVNIEEKGDELICSSKDIYIKPAVTWSGPDGSEAKTSISVSEKGLYSIFSSVTLLHSPPEEHSCNISTEHSWKSATYRLQHPLITAGYVMIGVLLVLLFIIGLIVLVLSWKHRKDFQERRSQERRLDRHRKLKEILASKGLYPKLSKSPSDGTEQGTQQAEKSKETRAPEEIPLNEEI